MGWSLVRQGLSRARKGVVRHVLAAVQLMGLTLAATGDRKSTRLNSSHRT